ncbi:MAG: hypothetical protein M3O15_02475 [Acidobacteriota bacterium]|nr:hypothetical protein [Acidobacteriota bacterium]
MRKRILAFGAVVSILAVAAWAMSSGTLQTFAGRVLVTDGAAEPLDGSPAGLGLFYDHHLDAGGIQAIQSGDSLKPLLLNPLGGCVGVGGDCVSQFSVTGHAQDVKTAYGQIYVSDTENDDTRHLVLGFSNPKGVAWMQAEWVGVQYDPLALQPAGGNVGLGTLAPGSALTVAGGDVQVTDPARGVILTAPGGACFRLTVAADGKLSTAAVVCP